VVTDVTGLEEVVVMAEEFQKEVKEA